MTTGPHPIATPAPAPSPALVWRRRLPGLALAIAVAVASYWLASLPGLKVIGPLTVALLIGLGVRSALGMPAAAVEGTKFSARTVLRLGIVLMGARLNFALVAQAGPKIFVLDLLIIVAGLVGITAVARRFGVPPKLATLLAVGTSICGASAVVAAGSVTRAKEEDVTLAVGLCGILGTLGALFYVFAGEPLLALTGAQLAVLSGSTLHEVAQVMAAAFSWGTEAGSLGTLVKLTRVVLLAPTLVVLGLLADGGGKVKYTWKEPPVPWFVVGFIVVGVLFTVGVLPPLAKDWTSTASIFLMAVAMAAMGLNIQMQMVRKAGMRVMYAGLAGFAGLGCLGWLLIHVLGIR